MISKDTSPLEVYACEFVIDNGQLGFMATDSERNLCIFVYSPESKESMGGQRLIRKADTYVGKIHKLSLFSSIKSYLRSD
jgi:cleavage and polyadenylation specificity factor subunit 1